jgi:hypothetical protein
MFELKNLSHYAELKAFVERYGNPDIEGIQRSGWPESLRTDKAGRNRLPETTTSERRLKRCA